MDDILLNEAQKVSAMNHESPEFLENNYNDNDLYQVENTSFEENKEKIYWHKRAFKYESSYVIENRNKMIYIYDK